MEKAIVLQTANEEFMRLGIRSVSMDDISSKLGISKKKPLSGRRQQKRPRRPIYRKPSPPRKTTHE